MKRKLIASIIGIAASLAVTSAHAQGRITLDNYNTTGPAIVYGSGPNQIGGTIAGNGILNGSGPNGVAGNVSWTLGLYWALGDVTATVGSDSSGFGTSSFNGMTLGTGTGATTGALQAGQPGTFNTVSDFSIPGWVSGPVTVELIAYTGSSYDTAGYRGHSTAFTMAPATGSDFGKKVGTAMSSFGVFAVPEPSTFALAGLGAAALLAFRRKK